MYFCISVIKRYRPGWLFFPAGHLRFGRGVLGEQGRGELDGTVRRIHRRMIISVVIDVDQCDRAEVPTHGDGQLALIVILLARILVFGARVDRDVLGNDDRHTADLGRSVFNAQDSVNGKQTGNGDAVIRQSLLFEDIRNGQLAGNERHVIVALALHFVAGRRDHVLADLFTFRARKGIRNGILADQALDRCGQFGIRIAGFFFFIFRSDRDLCRRDRELAVHQGDRVVRVRRLFCRDRDLVHSGILTGFTAQAVLGRNSVSGYAGDNRRQFGILRSVVIIDLRLVFRLNCYGRRRNDQFAVVNNDLDIGIFRGGYNKIVC